MSKFRAEVPLYNSERELIDWITPKRLKHLESLDLLARVVRSPKGQARRAYLKWRLGDPEPILRVRSGTRYSFREKLPEAAKVVWTLKRLGVGDELRPIFLRVVTDCLRAQPS